MGGGPAARAPARSSTHTHFAMRAAASLPLGDRRDDDHAPPPPSGASPAPGPGHDAGSWSDLGSDDDEPFPSHSTAANA